MQKISLAIALLLLFMPAAYAQTQQQPKITDCRNATVIPGTTPMSCDVSASRVEYQGATNDAQIALSCLWTVQNGVPVADTRYYVTHAFTPRMGTEQITLRADDKIVAILVQGNGPIQTEVLTAGGVVAKNCATLDIASFSASGCVPAQPAIPPQMIADTDAAMTQDCRNYVQAMATGGSINAPYFDPNAAAMRLNGARGFAAGLSK